MQLCYNPLSKAITPENWLDRSVAAFAVDAGLSFEQPAACGQPAWWHL
jgi:hypothetical protein